MHPVAACLDAVQAALAEVMDAPCWSLSTRELAELTCQAGHAVTAMAELRLRLIAAADVADVGATNGATSTTGWLAHADRARRNDAAADVRLAKALDTTCEATRRALLLGRVNPAQALVITTALTDLPGWIGEAKRAEAETWLLDHAAEFGPDELRLLARRIWEVIDPDGADDRDGKLLEAEEARARHLARLVLRRAGDGTTRGTFRLPDAQADMLRTWCEAATAPRRGRLTDTDADEQVPYPVRMGRALGVLAEHLPSDGFSHHGALPAIVTVNIDYHELRDCLGSAMLSTGTPVSAGQARRLACNTGLLPMVFDGSSAILDLGRTERLFDRYQRIALATTNRGCIWPGCDRPPAWCEAHHIDPWAEGGRTDIKRGCLLCVTHHHLAHNGEWRITMAADGIPEVIPPVRIDPRQRPRRHARFRRRSPGPA